MKKIAFAVHGGAGESSRFLRKHSREYGQGLEEALQRGHRILSRGGSALDAVVEGVKSLEDNPLFNAGRGSALNCAGKVEMDASIMDGRTLKAGAVSMVTRIKNPIELARVVMKKTRHVFLSGYGALLLAEQEGIVKEDEDYFITPYQLELYSKLNCKEAEKDLLNKKIHGTVGAVALDKKGNLAAATSTGGTSNCLPGRIGDSCVIGAGCYANNRTCAVSGTGEGEYLIRGVTGHSISMLKEFTGMSLQQCCDEVLKNRFIQKNGEIGVISISHEGEVGIAYNTKIMKRAWISASGEMQIKIF